MTGALLGTLPMLLMLAEPEELLQKGEQDTWLRVLLSSALGKLRQAQKLTGLGEVFARMG